jgi:hypothetical protein
VASQARSNQIIRIVRSALGPLDNMMDLKHGGAVSTANATTSAALCENVCGNVLRNFIWHIADT